MKTVFAMITGEEEALPFYVRGIGIQNNQEHIIRRTGFPYFQWIHCTKGEGILLLEDNQYTIHANKGFFLYPDVPHEYYSVSEPWTTQWISFDGKVLEPLLSLLNINKCGVYDIYSLSMLEQTLEDIYFCLCSSNPLKVVECSSLLYQFLIKLKICIYQNDKVDASIKDKQLQPIIEFMQDKYNTNLCLNDMSAIINVSPYHMCRIFKETYHITPFQYLTRIRMKKAKEFLIQSSGLNIKDIAKMAGYNDTSYFCAVFKENEGMTPMEFKRMYGKIE